MSDFPEDLFQQLYRRAPTDSDRDRLVAVKASLGLSPRDEMWPIIMTLDYYTATNQAARNATVKDLKVVLQAIKEIPEAAGPLAAEQARKAIAEMIDAAAERISKIAVKRSETRADHISKRQLITAAIVGSLIACSIAIAISFATYSALNARGICAEAPVTSASGDLVCYVKRKD